MIFADNLNLSKIKKLKICVLSGTGKLTRNNKTDLIAENDTKKTSEQIFKDLKQNGFKDVSYLFVNDHNIKEIYKIKADVILNLTEGEQEKFLNSVCKILSQTNIPFSGSLEETNILTTNKLECKNFLIQNNIPTPKFFLIQNLKELLFLENQKQAKFPLILKPLFEDGSTGISQKSVVENFIDLRSQAKKIIQKYHQPAIAEKYIDGREFSITLIEINGKPQILPIAELIYKKIPERKWNVYSYTAKWIERSKEYINTPAIAPAKISQKTKKEIENICKKTFEVFKIKDYARIDIRYSKKSRVPYVIDINTNPSLEIDPKYSLTKSIFAAGLKNSDFVTLILASTLRRYNINL